jgi:formylglycine-generating enzyme required for sulfatase activity
VAEGGRRGLWQGPARSGCNDGVPPTQSIRNESTFSSDDIKFGECGNSAVIDTARFGLKPTHSNEWIEPSPLQNIATSVFQTLQNNDFVFSDDPNNPLGFSAQQIVAINRVQSNDGRCQAAGGSNRARSDWFTRGQSMSDHESTFLERWPAARARIANSPAVKRKRRKALLQALCIGVIGLPIALALTIVCERLGWSRSIYVPGLLLTPILVFGSYWADGLSSSALAVIALVLYSTIANAAGSAIAGPDDRSLKAGQTFRDCSDCPEMVVLAAGSFTMGSSAADTMHDLESVPAYAIGLARVFMAREHPQHTVSIAHPFALGKYHVTRAEFAAFLRDTGYSMASGDCFILMNNQYKKIAGAGWQSPGFTQTDRDPVLCVSWHDAEAYVAWLNSKLRGLNSTYSNSDGPYHLPSEAEWEYAARAGAHTARWWGDAIGSANADCGGCGSHWDKKQTAPVGSFRPNSFGLYDMLGNAWQWMSDCWNQSYVGAPDDGTVWTTGDCAKRVVRGGNWNSDPWILRSATRSSFEAGNLANYVGFRVARTLPRSENSR